MHLREFSTTNITKCKSNANYVVINRIFNSIYNQKQMNICVCVCVNNMFLVYTDVINLISLGIEKLNIARTRKNE